MSHIMDMDVLKEIPGYKAILKSVVKTQIQLLIEQLSDHTGEESIILTASVNDGTLSQLGSDTGKSFLEGREEIKSQFLGHCLKSHHKKKTQEAKAPPYQRSNLSHPGARTPAQQHVQPSPNKRQKVHPVSMTRLRPVHTEPPDIVGGPSDMGTPVMPDRSHRRPSIPTPTTPASPATHGTSIHDDSSTVNIKREGMDNSDISTSDPNTSGFSTTELPASIQLSHTQTSTDNNSQLTFPKDTTAGASDLSNLDSSNIKVEPEGDMDLEITGVDVGDGGEMTEENWGAAGMGQSSVEGDGSFQGGDTEDYKYAAPCKDNTGVPPQGSESKKQLIISCGNNSGDESWGTECEPSSTHIQKKDILDKLAIDIDSEDDDVISLGSFDECLYQELFEDDFNISSGSNSQEFRPASPEDDREVLGNNNEYSSNNIDNGSNIHVQLENVEGSPVDIVGKIECMNVDRMGANIGVGEIGICNVRSLQDEANIEVDESLQNVGTDINFCGPPHMSPENVHSSVPNSGNMSHSKAKSPLSVQKKKRASWHHSSSKLESVEDRTCNVCSKELRTKWDLFEHESVHTKEKRYLCSKCKSRFTGRCVFTKHFKQCKPIDTELHYSCFKCNDLFKSLTRFYAHFSACNSIAYTKIANIHVSKPPKLDDNDNVQISENHQEPPVLQKESLVEKSATFFTCEHCSMRFKFRIQKNFHLRKCTGLASSTQLDQKVMVKKTSRQSGRKAYAEDRTCDCCNKIWDRLSDLRHHLFAKMMASVSPEEKLAIKKDIKAFVGENLSCRKCRNCFSTDLTLQKHIIMKHISIKYKTKLDVPTEQPTGKKSELISKRIKKNTVLDSKHTKGKLNEDRTCSCCNKVWLLPYLMRNHMLKKQRSMLAKQRGKTKRKTHIPDPKPCSYCGKVFGSAYSMRKHSLIHKCKSSTKSLSVKRTGL